MVERSDGVESWVISWEIGSVKGQKLKENLN